MFQYALSTPLTAATPLPKAYDCVAVYIKGRRTKLVVYGWRPKPPTKKHWYVLLKIIQLIKQNWLLLIFGITITNNL